MAFCSHLDEERTLYAERHIDFMAIVTELDVVHMLSAQLAHGLFKTLVLKIIPNCPVFTKCYDLGCHVLTQ